MQGRRLQASNKNPSHAVVMGRNPGTQTFKEFGEQCIIPFG
jgi:hypothetical protein